jgi:hypothetical protein
LTIGHEGVDDDVAGVDGDGVAEDDVHAEQNFDNDDDGVVFGQFLKHNRFSHGVSESEVAQFREQDVHEAQTAQSSSNQVREPLLGFSVAGVHNGHDCSNALEHEEAEPNGAPVAILINRIVDLWLHPASLADIGEAENRDHDDCEDDHGHSEHEGEAEFLDLADPRDRGEDAQDDDSLDDLRGIGIIPWLLVSELLDSVVHASDYESDLGNGELELHDGHDHLEHSLQSESKDHPHNVRVANLAGVVTTLG